MSASINNAKRDDELPQYEKNIIVVKNSEEISKIVSIYNKYIINNIWFLFFFFYYFTKILKKVMTILYQ